MMKVKSFILAGLLAFAPAMAMNGQALAQNEAAASAAATPVDADPRSSDPGAPADSADANVANVSAAAPAPKVAAPPRMKPTEGIGMPRPGEITLQQQFTDTGRTARWLHDVMLLPIITIISLLVLALMLYVMVRYRRAANPIPSKTSHNTVIEVVWTVVPVLILLAIAVPSIGLLADQYRPAPKDALTVKVTGYQWYWGYEYPDAGIPEFVSNMLPEDKAKANGEPYLLAPDNRLVLPVGRPIKLIITGADVIHSFAVPSLWVKMDAVPGRLNEKSFTIDKPGVYYGQCSELCGPRVQGAIIQGIDPALEPKVSVIDKKVTKGSYASLTPGSFNLLLGKELAIWLGVDVGDQVLVTFAEVQGTPAGAVPRMKRFTVSGIFEAGYNEVDRGVGFANMQDLERVLRSDGATGVRLKLHDMDRSLEVGVDLAQSLGGAYRVSDWTQQNANLYHSLRMEKVVMGILLSLIIAMGAFNLVSSQVMLVTDKQADIAILRTLGLTPGGVMQVFMVQGSLIGIFGTLAGLIGGITLTLNLERILGAIESVFNVKLLPEDVYYITGLPTDMQTGDVVAIAVVALLMSFLATLYPAWRAARTQPAEALRYE